MSGVAAIRSSLAGAISANRLRSVYQPLVELGGGETVGYEALIRGPRGSDLERPDQLFAAAEADGLSVELERECVLAAARGFERNLPRDGLALFVNVEPSMIAATGTGHLSALEAVRRRGVPVFVELTERDLMADPLALFRAVDDMRSLGLGIALDDVGVCSESLALIPFLEPDVIKLDMSLTQAQLSPRMAAVFHAVSAEAERTNAVVVAEGIETEAHRERALALGARYGQGWLFAPPRDIPAEPAGSSAMAPAPPREQRRLDEDSTPFEIVTRERSPRLGRKALLLKLSLELETQAAQFGSPGVVLATFQDASHFTSRSRARYERLAGSQALVGLLGVGLGGLPADGVRGAALDREEPFRGEWDVIVIGPHYGAAFVARDLGDGCADMDRRFEFAYTHDRELTIRAATSMLRRLAAS